MSFKARPTDTDYADMAADYEAHPPTADEVVSIDVDPVRLRTGRPAKGAAGGKTPVLAIRLPEAIRLELDERAKAEGANVSELVRRAVVEFLGNDPR